MGIAEENIMLKCASIIASALVLNTSKVCHYTVITDGVTHDDYVR